MHSHIDLDIATGIYKFLPIEFEAPYSSVLYWSVHSIVLNIMPSGKLNFIIAYIF